MVVKTKRLLAAIAASALLIAALTFPATGQAAASEVVVYDDDLAPGFTNWSSAPSDLRSTGFVAAGTASLQATMGVGQAVFIGNYRLTDAPAGGALEFSVHPGENAEVELAVQVGDANGVLGPDVPIEVAGGGWKTVAVPLAELGNPARIGRVRFANAGGAALSPIWFDEISFVADPAPSADPEQGAGGTPTDPNPSPTPPAVDPEQDTDPGTPVPMPVDPPPPVTDPEQGPAPTPEVEPTSVPNPPPAPTSAPQPLPDGFAFFENFDEDPDVPSQADLPGEFDYMVTHRTHPQHQFEDGFYPTYQADHGDNCAGPNPEVDPLPSHTVQTTQTSNGVDIDPSFFICKNHMMSSLGEVEAYSVSAFWPRQEFDFSDGGTLTFAVNINEGHTFRHWWEVMIVPRDQIRMGAGPVDSAIDETYPEDRIVLTWRRNVRGIKVGTGDIAPNGWLFDEEQFATYDWAYWRTLHPEDAETFDDALNDRRDRRTMRIRLDGDQIIWGIETKSGEFDEWVAEIPGGLPFERGIVMFKTHSYTPAKDGNTEYYTFHWDNIGFDGPVLEPYESHWADTVVDLQRNGDRPIGDTQTVTVQLRAGAAADDPVLVGQINQPVQGQVLLSINGGPDIAVGIDSYDNADCWSNDWKTFVLPLDPAMLVDGENTLEWTVGPRPACAEIGIGPDGPGAWDGYSVKGLHIQTGG